jgi:hypothetical protein
MGVMGRMNRVLSTLTRERLGWVVAGIIALAIVGGGVAWAVTRNHHASATPASKAAGNGGAVRGRVTAVAADSLTLRVRGGTTMTVLLGAKTRYGNKAHPGSRADLRAGETVRVTGDTSGATVSAKRVVIVSGGGGNGGSGTTTSTRPTS